MELRGCRTNQNMESRVKRTEVIRNGAQKMQNLIEMEYRMKELTEMEHTVHYVICTGAKRNGSQR